MSKGGRAHSSVNINELTEEKVRPLKGQLLTSINFRYYGGDGEFRIRQLINGEKRKGG